MAKVGEFISWILTVKREFTKEEVKLIFALVEDNWNKVLKVLKEKNFIMELRPDNYIIAENALSVPNYTKETLKPLIENYFSGKENNNAEIGRIGWDTIKNIEKFKVYPGDDLKIYEIHLKGKMIRMEGKEIMDSDVFILKLFETFGIMLPVYRTLKHDWAQMVSFWMQNFGETVESHQENISVGTEAVDAVVSYINHAVISNDYIVKDGFVTYKNDMLYVPTKCIKKLLKREELNISLRKLAYLMKDYLISGSVPLKVENKSERFWKLYTKKFEVQLDKEIKLEKEPDTEDDSQERSSADSQVNKTLEVTTHTEQVITPTTLSSSQTSLDPVQVVKTLDPVLAPNPSPEALLQPPEEDRGADDEDTDIDLEEAEYAGNKD
jgi:hypothetical protein